MTETTPAMTELEKKREEKAQQEAEYDKWLDTVIPIPVGFSILVTILEPEEAYESGIIKPEQTIRAEEILASTGLVIDIGPQAYKGNDEKYSEGPWCKQGDYVMFRPNSGTRFRLGKREYRLLNDDSVEAIVPNPSVIRDAR